MANFKSELAKLNVQLNKFGAKIRNLSTHEMIGYGSITLGVVFIILGLVLL